jgi:small GTP-binding protein
MVDVLHCKVVLLGDTGTGKTSIIHRLIHREFDSQLRMTLGAGLSPYWVRCDGRSVKLNIWDTAGQENYRSLTRIYLRDAQCVLLCYDLAERATFQGIHFWLKELEQLVPGSYIQTIVASKCDLRNHRQVTEEEGRAFAKDVRAEYREVSAASGEGVAPLFEEVAERCVRFAGDCRALELARREKVKGGCC